MLFSNVLDPELPIIEKEVSVNDFVINVEKLGDIVPMSVGVVKSVSGDTVSVLFIGKARHMDVRMDMLIVIDVFKTGKLKGSTIPPFKYKICNRCHVLKKQCEFANNQNDGQKRHTTRPTCKACRVEIDGVNLTSSEKRRMDLIKPKPYELFECPICRKVTIPGITANIVRDHDHRTGKGRDWICDSCNTGIGRFQDDPDIFAKIVAYIRHHNSDVY